MLLQLIDMDTAQVIQQKMQGTHVEQNVECISISERFPSRCECSFRTVHGAEMCTITVAILVIIDVALGKRARCLARNPEQVDETFCQDIEMSSIYLSCLLNIGKTYSISNLLEISNSRIHIFEFKYFLLYIHPKYPNF